MDARQEHFPWEDAGGRLGDTLMPLLSFNRARQRVRRDYAFSGRGAGIRRLPRLRWMLPGISSRRRKGFRA